MSDIVYALEGLLLIIVTACGMAWITYRYGHWDFRISLGIAVIPIATIVFYTLSPFLSGSVRPLLFWGFVATIFWLLVCWIATATIWADRLLG